MNIHFIFRNTPWRPKQNKQMVKDYHNYFYLTNIVHNIKVKYQRVLYHFPTYIIHVYWANWVCNGSYISVWVSWNAIWWYIWGVLCQKQVSWAGASNYIPQYLWGVITYPRSWYLSLAQWASCQIRKIAGCACAGNAGNVSPHYRGLKRYWHASRHVRHARAVMHVGIFQAGSLYLWSRILSSLYLQMI